MTGWREREVRPRAVFDLQESLYLHPFTKETPPKQRVAYACPCPCRAACTTVFVYPARHRFYSHDRKDYYSFIFPSCLYRRLLMLNLKVILLYFIEFYIRNREYFLGTKFTISETRGIEKYVLTPFTYVTETTNSFKE